MNKENTKKFFNNLIDKIYDATNYTSQKVSDAKDYFINTLGDKISTAFTSDDEKQASKKNSEQKFSDFDKARIKANHEILLILSIIMEERPMLRFGQILHSAGLINEQNDGFYTEPSTMVKTLKEYCAKNNINI